MKTSIRDASAIRQGLWLVGCTLLLAGCRSDLGQQLLERELRYQEDQIYQLQDELREKCDRLERAAGENVSLRRQLGLGSGDQVAPRSAPVRQPAAGAVPVPPAIELPDGPRPPAPPVKPAPPDLEGVPPLPTSGAGRPTALPAGGLVFPPGPALIDPAARPVESTADAASGRRASFDAPAAEGRPARLVVNPQHTTCLAGSDGAGLRLVFEVRDDEERLVAAAGDVTVTVFDAADAAPVARWEIPAAQAAGHFRRTSRNRGLHFEFPWQGRGPAGDTVRVVVGFAPSGGQPLETEATIRTR